MTGFWATRLRSLANQRQFSRFDAMVKWMRRQFGKVWSVWCLGQMVTWPYRPWHRMTSGSAGFHDAALLVLRFIIFLGLIIVLKDKTHTRACKMTTRLSGTSASIRQAGSTVAVVSINLRPCKKSFMALTQSNAITIPCRK